MFFKIVSKAKHITSGIANSIYGFIVKEGWLIIIYTVLLFFPEFRRNPFGYMQWGLNPLPFCFVLGSFICLVGRTIMCIVGGRWGNAFFKGWHIICHLIIYGVSFLDIYLLTAFKLTISHDTLLLLLQTNTDEAKEFINIYLFEKSFLLCILIFAILGLAEWFVLKYSHKFNIFKHYFVVALCVVLFSMGLYACRFAYNAFTISDPTDAYDALGKIKENSLFKAYFTTLLTKEDLKMGEVLDKHISDTRVNSITQYNGKIVLIIGESHMKGHSSLYCYNKNTNPNLALLKDNLYVYQDVITHVNKTHITLREMLSTSSVDDDIEWNKVTLFPAVFKAAGWNVVFCSNQISSSISKDIWNAALDAFLNTPKTTEACFSTRNSSTFKYDEQMVDSFIVNRNKAIDFQRPTLYIIQLKGQHMKYDERFPKNQAHFTIDDYSDRINLTSSQKQIVADYDNACRYSDKQLYKLFKAFEDDDAIVIYVSDHGEEVYDYRDKQGRFADLKDNAPISYHCQIDVPFVIYMTESFKRNHPEKARRVESSIARPFMTDDICHLLFFLGDVDTEWFDPKRCLIHDDYNTKRKRRLYYGEYYEDWVK